MGIFSIVPSYRAKLKRKSTAGIRKYVPNLNHIERTKMVNF